MLTVTTESCLGYFEGNYGYGDDYFNFCPFYCSSCMYASLPVLEEMIYTHWICNCISITYVAYSWRRDHFSNEAEKVLNEICSLDLQLYKYVVAYSWILDKDVWCCTEAPNDTVQCKDHVHH